MLASILFHVPLLLLPIVELPSPTRDCLIERQRYHAVDDLATAHFHTAVSQYAALHRRLDRTMSPIWISSDPELRQMAADALASAIRTARAHARQGEIFTPGVAAMFRYQIEKTLWENDEGPAYPVWEDEPGPALVVNGRIPWGVASTRRPFPWALPRLPEELEYRLVTSTLVLLDVRADLIVDILPDALPVP